MTISTVMSVCIIIPCCRYAASIYIAIDLIIKQIKKSKDMILVGDAINQITLRIKYKIANQYLIWIKLIGLISYQDAINTRNSRLDAKEWCTHYLNFFSGLLV